MGLLHNRHSKPVGCATGLTVALRPAGASSAQGSRQVKHCHDQLSGRRPLNSTERDYLRHVERCAACAESSLYQLFSEAMRLSRGESPFICMMSPHFKDLL